MYPSSVSWKITPLCFFSSHNIYFAQKEPITVKIFETLECSGQNLWNSLCHFPNDKSISLQILHHSSLSLQITPLWIWSSNFFYFRLKNPIKVPILRLSSAIQILHHPSVSWKITPLYFLGQTLNTLHNMSKWKCKSWRLSSAWVKFHQILVIFETTYQFFFKFCINLQGHEI